MRPKFTMILPFSRAWALKRWIQAFRRLDIDRSQTELLVLVDSDDGFFCAEVMRALYPYRNSLFDLRISFSGRPKLQEKASIAKRRERIAENWTFFMKEARGEIILGAEDDTLPPPDAYRKLLEVMHEKKAGFVQGTEVGRWSSRMIPHWRIMEDENGNPARLESGRYYGEDIVPIEGGGWYCFVMPRSVFKSVIPRQRNDLAGGVDVHYVYKLTKLHFKCFGVWSVKCIHFGEDFELHQDRTKLVFRESWNDNGRWRVRQEFMPKKSDDLR